jgi:hypothetical protein
MWRENESRNELSAAYPGNQTLTSRSVAYKGNISIPTETAVERCGFPGPGLATRNS